ncbi:MAG TPA: FAD-dependent oxidoreductase [Actinomycetes bacterium]|jgi:glycine/D-amino acid oxidase-like deaminating enzyme/nitrite reductase/ring-hydroxylating ferredoxin subunit|nr:FAD-dependent oxidoreductase [Actinomycetes bacterium]
MRRLIDVISPSEGASRMEGSDGNVSYWVATTPETDFPGYPGGDLKVDVAVLGGGITGLATALLLQQAGASVAVVEAGRLACGVTGYTTAKVTSLHGLTYAKLTSTFGAEGARIYGEANQAGLELIASLVEQLGIDCDFERLPAFTYTEDPLRVSAIEEEVEAAQEAGLPASFSTEIGLPFPVQGAVRFEGQAQFHPRRFCLGLAEAIDAGGGQVFERTRAVNIRPGAPCTVDTEHGRLRAEHVVLATHLPFFDPAGLFAKTSPSRSYAAVVTLAEPAPPGMYLSADAATRSVRPLALGSRQAVLAGEEHKTGHGRDTRSHYQELEAWARERFPVRSLDHRWSAQDYLPADNVPYIGRLIPGYGRLHVATGFKKWGMTHSAVAASLLCDQITGRPNPWSELFRATRLRPLASAKELAAHNLDVGLRFAGDRLRTARPSPARDLAPGEAGIRQLDGEKVAAYRDEDGRLHAVSGRCTHLGCLVAWNAAERTWDCPCHGSRYTYEGKVIQGPAVGDLAPRPLEQG